MLPAHLEGRGEEVGLDARELADAYPDAVYRRRPAALGLGFDPLQQRRYDRVLMHGASLKARPRPGYTLRGGIAPVC